MKRLFLFLLICGIIVFGFFSCQFVKKGDLRFEDRLIIELEAKVLEDDHFELFFKGQEEKYKPIDKKEYMVKGSNDFQVIQFVLDQHVYPQNIKLDLGKNMDQGPIVIKKLSLKYNEGEHIFTKEELKKFFITNTDFVFDYDTLTGHTRKVGDTYDPFIHSYNISKFVNRLILY